MKITNLYKEIVAFLSKKRGNQHPLMPQVEATNPSSTDEVIKTHGKGTEPKSENLCSNTPSPQMSEVTPKSLTRSIEEKKNVKVLDMSQYSTEGVKDMHELFSDYENLKRIDLLGFDTKYVENMSHMFFGCKSLESIELSWFATRSCVTMEAMFSCCESLRELDLSNFDTSKVRNYVKMFDGCRSLERLDLSSFYIMQDADMDNMFANCNNLSQIIMHGCSRQTVDRVINEYYDKFGKLIDFVTDEVMETYNMVGTDETLEERIGNEYGSHYLCAYPYYVSDWMHIVYDEDQDIVEGYDYIIRVKSISCKVGECFSIAGDYNYGDECSRISYYTFKLLSIIAQNGNTAIISVELVKLGSATDFVKKAIDKNKLKHYSRIKSPLRVRISHQDEEKGIHIYYVSDGSGDWADKFFVYTIEGIDHLLVIEYWDFFKYEYAVIFCDHVLGLHELSPYADHLFRSVDYVDLGLPSGTQWAKTNYGTSTPEELGPEYTQDELPTGLPTYEQACEFIEHCSFSPILFADFSKGWRATGPNGNSLFFRVKPNNEAYMETDATTLWCRPCDDYTPIMVFSENNITIGMVYHPETTSQFRWVCK